MAFEIIMPKLGVDMQEGEIIEWKKQEGDVVNEGDILLEIMSDKTNMELEAEDSGVLLKITRQAGETVPVTEVIGYIGAEGEVVADNAASAPAAEAADEGEFEIIKNKRFIMHPMTPEEAILQMNLLNHDFFVFYDPDLGATNVVYRRKDGKYGLLSPELK